MSHEIIDEVEINFLSLLLKNGNLVFEATQRLKPFMFSSRVHEFIFSAICSLAAKGIEATKVLVKHELVMQGKLDGAGGDSYLNEIVLHYPEIEEFSAYISIIEDAYKSRELYKISNAVQKAVDTNKNPNKILTALTTKISSLNDLGGVVDVVHIGDASDTFVKSLESHISNPGITGISTGFKEIDEFTMGYNEGEIWMIGARPSVGKTALLVKSGLSVAINDTPFLLVNREMTILPLLERIYSILTGIPFTNIRLGKINEDQLNKINETREFIRNKPFYIDNTWSGDEHVLYNIIRKYHHKVGIRIVGIDYIQLLAERDENSTATLGRISRNLKLLSGELGLTTVVLSQLSRDVEFRDDKRPLAKDLRQSGNLEEDADIMAGLYRDEIYFANSPYAGTLEFIIRKQRNGPIGTCHLKFDTNTVNISDLSEAKNINWDEQTKREGKSVGKRSRRKPEQALSEYVEA
jgi:replicative DNA helicase